jgi:hypothetical protein
MKPGFLIVILATLLLLSPLSAEAFPITAILIVYVAGLFFFGLNAFSRDQIVLYHLPRTALAFVALIIFLIMLRPQDLDSAKHLAQMALGFSVIYLLASQVRAQAEAETLIKQLMVASLLCFYVAYLISILAMISGHRLGNYALPWESNYVTVRGGLLGSNQVAAILATLAVVSCLFLNSSKNITGGARIFLMSTLLVAGHVILASATRSGYLAIVSIPFIALAYRNKINPAIFTGGIIFITLFITLLLYVPPEWFRAAAQPLTDLGKALNIRLINEGLIGADILLTGRTVLWKGLLQMILDHPILGLGKDLPYTTYGIPISNEGNGGEASQAMGALLGGNDSGFSLIARHGIPFGALLFLTMLGPLFTVREPRIKTLAHHIASIMVLFWLANGSFQFLYTPDAALIVIMAAIAAYTWNEARSSSSRYSLPRG